LVVLAKKAMAEPIPVASPAPSVTAKASSSALSKSAPFANWVIDEKLSQASLNSQRISMCNLGWQEHVT
jgi:hypothetical protein